MTTLKRCLTRALRVRDAIGESATVFLKDVGQGLLEVSHNMLALIGLLIVAAALFGYGKPELRHAVETEALGWLQARHEARAEPAELLAQQLSEPEAIARATAADPKELNRQQAAVAMWLSRRYRVAPEPISRLVQEAWTVGQRAGLDPTLILAIMAVESSFNPFAQSGVGAQGLMQVMTKVHDDKYEAFGGKHAAFDPVSNLRVGVQVLKECIARAGSLEAGLRYYVGAANLEDDGGYVGKVLAEQNNLRLVASGKTVSHSVALVPVSLPAAAASGVQRGQPQPAKAEPATDERPEQVALAH
ncbi:MAG TPA: lytic transglycosylase domain-containing protein [Piscinibacter sp.]|jgi:soluble lytic murein transglycosylase-like protein|uniref:lytic transglycosylase domain-containing protein n=1 Tax=Piscinibacter sp. TaxID=1903157 RepID=UPI001B67A6CC|nr:lytic transglycosylase domain-containing protein [Piscinibacter sp.]HNG81341.1 lytic transglycosylase domain-containing protein [Burkholderiaceae bacterium]MBP5988999.1 lytic transglycosylase domain-containing protein [Piscinibacter sp.]MBP6026281.1 lytic transglycosylase domain-containing protein [Piscinibacter sp.]HNJ83961.1 lytic transglycosylase domain-containing protein [Piscinibacter sp.]HNK18971.1 lytic transglycosylase domain-containing protein [Piscinibacter sp.]